MSSFAYGAVFYPEGDWHLGVPAQTQMMYEQMADPSLETRGLYVPTSQWMQADEESIPEIYEMHLDSAQLNSEMIAAAESKASFLDFVNRLCASRVRLNFVNVATMLHRAGKLRIGFDMHIVHYLTDNVRQGQARNEMLRAQQVGNLLYGLQRFGDTDDVREFIKVVTEQTRRCSEKLQPRHISQALFGLQQLEDSVEVRELLLVLTKKIRQCRQKMDAQGILNSIIGLQSMGPSVEVLQLLAVVTPSIKYCEDRFNKDEGQLVLLTLDRLGEAQEVRKAFEELSEKIAKTA